MDIVFTQTSDSHVYLDLLTATSRTVRAYCDRRDFQYESYIGVKRGFWPWQASFNRIYMLQELVARGRYDWAVYMDADAFIADLGFDLRAYLGRFESHAAVMVRSGVTDDWWDVNDGVLLVNLRHPTTHRLLDHWRTSYEAISDDTLRSWPTWGNPDDQEMLQFFLRDNEEVRGDIEFASPALINSIHASFIPQMLRSMFTDKEARLQAVRDRVERILAAVEGEPPPPSTANEDFIQSVYRGMLRRDADEYGLEHYGALFNVFGFEGATRKLVKDVQLSEEFRTWRLTPLAPPAPVQPTSPGASPQFRQMRRAPR